MTTEGTIRVTVDSVEDGVVTVEQENEERITVPLELFPTAREGGIYDVPVRNGSSLYSEARRDSTAEHELKQAAARQIATLSAGDSGGDMAL